MAEGGIKNVLCRYFLNGACQNGDSCNFSHDRQRGAPVMTCRYYMKGMCSYGSNCRFDHTKPEWKQKKSQEKKAVNRPPPPPPSRSTSNESVGGMKKLGPQKSLEEFIDAPVFVPRDEPLKSYAAAAKPSIEVQEGAVVGDPSELCPYLVATGTCPYNENCEYTHGDMCDMCNGYCLHPNDPAQRKQHEEYCVKMHEQMMEHSFAVARSLDKMCGICMDVVMDKHAERERRFGILPKCNHIFCLPCIRKWRQAKQFENKIIRACPECRVKSDYVCPSKYWVETPEEKEALLEDYKTALGKKPCKHFNQGRGSCPFGNKCFYLHANPDGTKVDLGPPKRRRRQKHNGEVELLETLILLDFIEERERETRWLTEAEFSYDTLDELLGSSDSDDSDSVQDLPDLELLLFGDF